MATYPNSWNNGMNQGTGNNGTYGVPPQMQQTNCPGGNCNNTAWPAQQRQTSGAAPRQNLDAILANPSATSAARSISGSMPIAMGGSLPGLNFISEPGVEPYQSVPVTAEQVQYLNGFLRSQIGKRVSIQFLIGSDQSEIREGVLLGVGYNYILLSQDGVDAYLACDFYNIKFVKVFY